jgi:hypothetical protein
VIRHRRRAFAAVAVVALTMAGACSLGNKQAMADKIIAAAARSEADGAAMATVSVRAQVIKSKLPVAPGPPKIVGGVAPDLKAAIDFKAGKAAVAFAGDDPTSAAMVFIGSQVFQRTDLKSAEAPPAAGLALQANQASGLNLPAGSGSVTSVGIDSNLSPLAAAAKATSAAPATTTTTAPPSASTSKLRRPITIQRKWIGFDYGSLPKHDKTKSAGSYAISPIAIEQLAKGALTGSLHLLGSETIDGQPMTHYKMNVSRDKAERHLPNNVRKDLDKTFRANAIGGRVFAAEAWVDANGRLRRFTVRMRQTLSRIDRADLTVTLDLAPAATPVVLPVPNPQETAEVKTLGALIHGAVK